MRDTKKTLENLNEADAREYNHLLMLSHRANTSEYQTAVANIEKRLDELEKIAQANEKLKGRK